jgi:hypothetical protein
MCENCDNNLKRKCALGTRIVNGIIAQELTDEYQCANDAKYAPEIEIKVTECKYFTKVAV